MTGRSSNVLRETENKNSKTIQKSKESERISLNFNQLNSVKKTDQLLTTKYNDFYKNSLSVENSVKIISTDRNNEDL